MKRTLHVIVIIGSLLATDVQGQNRLVPKPLQEREGMGMNFCTGILGRRRRIQSSLIYCWAYLLPNSINLFPV